jgi:hypothetical protein
LLIEGIAEANMDSMFPFFVEVASQQRQKKHCGKRPRDVTKVDTKGEAWITG